MPDKVLLIVFGSLSTLAFTFGGVSMYFAFKAAKKKEGEIKMALWAIAALAGLTFGGMSWAYFIIPILLNNLFN